MAEPTIDHLAKRPASRQGWRTMEKIIVAHLAILVVGISWAFGGQIGWARQALLGWGTLGIGLFFVALYQTWPEYREDARRRTRLHLWPLAAFDFLVLLSCLNPGFQAIFIEGEPYFKVATPPYTWLPSSARPDLSLRELWQFNAIVLSCYNLVLAVRSRRVLRTLLLVLALNSALLAILGTFQKFAGATGPWFVSSRQTYFFSTFVYHNHWGAFTLLVTGICLGLLFHYWRSGGYRDFWHSPVPAAAIALLLLAITIPLSGSRSSTLLLALLLGGAGLHAIGRIHRQRRSAGRPATGPVVALSLALLLGLGVIGYLGREMIAFRAQVTVEQVRHLDTIGGRPVVYRDTWRMAQEKPLFGWGLETYGDVFRIYNSIRADELLLGQPYYREAHSDWLQSLAETGFVGTGLLCALGAIPLFRQLRQLRGSVLARYLLAGCGLVLGYAWLEFPFANPAVMIAFWLSLYAAVRYAALDDRSRETA